MPRRKDKLSRRERERLRHRDEILQAARDIVAKKGLEGLTIEEIARKAEFAVGSIYRYFASKEDLLDVLLVDLARPFLEEVEALVAEERPFDETLSHYLEAFATETTAGLPALQLLHALPPGPPEATAASRQGVRETIRRLVEDVRALVAQGQAQGVLAEEDPNLVAVTLVGMCNAFARRAAYGVETDLQAATRIIRRAFLHGFAEPGVSPEAP